MKPEWEKGLRGRIYAWGRAAVPLAWRRAIRRRIAPERLLGIRKPAVEVVRYAFDPHEARPGRPDVLLLPVIAWSYRRQRPQQLAEALGRRGRRVFYGAIRGPGEPESPTGVAPGVTLLPIAGVAREDPPDRRLEAPALEAALASLSRARDEFELHECAVVVETPFWAPLAIRLAQDFGWKIVYDCLDDHSGFTKNRPGALAADEASLAASADLVIATSQVLLERVGRGAREARLLANAADYGLFAQGPAPRKEPGAPLTVGYVGAVDEWFDAPLFDELARLRPGWRFEIVGGGEGPAASRPRAAQNVVFHGERGHPELPALRARFDAEIIPFRKTALTDAVDPVKFYEAAAAGRPVVATPLRSLELLARRGLLRTASTAAGFAAAIEEAVARRPEEGEALRAFARENTWDVRARQLEEGIVALYPCVSVLVVSWNGLEWSRSCLEALDRRTDWPNLQIVWADNGSTDGSAEWLAAEANRRDPAGFTAIRFPENRGFAPAVNAAAARARGVYLVLLNNDTLVTRGWLSALVRHLERDPGLGMVGASTNEIANAARVEVGYREAGELEAWARRFTAARRGAAEPIGMLAMFCAAIPRRVWDAVGPLDERFQIGMFEDDDYARRLAERGLRLAVARDAFVHHWGRGSFRALPDEEYRRLYSENSARFEEKWKALPSAEAAAPRAERILEEADAAGGVFVFPPSIGWDITLVQRPHHLARALARAGFPVVFEEEPQRPAARPPVEQVEPRLYVARRRIEELRSVCRVYWTFAYNVPDDADLADALLVYDIIDHPDVFPHPRALLRRNHERALARADVVLAVSGPLRDEVRERRPDVLYVPNAVDFERFAAPPDPSLVPERLRRRADRPAAIFLGALARWVDAPLLRELAGLRPDWDFVLVGERLDATCGDLPARGDPANLSFAGAVAHVAVPAVLSVFDAALLPFRLGSEGANASPVKLYEYLAAGLPVIATPIAEARSLPEVRIAPDAPGFAEQLDAARRDRASPAYRERARAVARANDWSARAAGVLAALKLPRPCRAAVKIRAESGLKSPDT